MSYLDDLAEAIRAEVSKDLLPKENVADLFRLYALLVRVKGEAVSAEDVHDAWAAWMLRQADDDDHESIKPFEELDAETRREDEPFVEAIRKVARGLLR